MTRTQRLMASVMAALSVTAAADTRPAPAAERGADGAPVVTIAQVPVATPSPYYGGGRGGASGGAGHIYRTSGEERPGCAGRLLHGFGRAFRGGG